MEDLVALPWYHGPTTRINAELSLQDDGDFLVRDCISSPGDYVLTCRWKNQVLHFRMNQGQDEESGKTTFHFESETFASVAKLVQHHWRSQKPITQVSGARIKRPIFRAKARKNCEATTNGGLPRCKENGDFKGLSDEVVLRSKKNGVAPRPCQSMVFEACSLASQVIKLDRNQSNSLPRPKSSDLLSYSPIMTSFSTFKRSPSESSLPPLTKASSSANGAKMAVVKPLTMPFPNDIDLSNKATADPKKVYDVPQKPRSCLSQKQVECNGLYDHPRSLKKHRLIIPPPPPLRGANQVQNALVKAPPTSMSENFSDLDSCSLISEMSNTDTSLLEHRELTPLLSSSDNENESSHFDNSSLPGDPFPAGLFIQDIHSSKTLTKMDGGSKDKNSLFQSKDQSSFDHSDFGSEPLCISSGNKPLEANAIMAANQVILSCHSGLELAMHLVSLNCSLLSIQLDQCYPGLPDIRSGIHLITLVDGQQLRIDIMDRFLCLRYFVLITIFSATNWASSVKVVAKWIDTAEACLTQTGDHLSLFAIVTALTTPRLRAVEALWKNLEDAQPEAATKLNQTLLVAVQELNRGHCVDGQRPEPPLIVPHLVPFLAGCRDLREGKTFKAVFAEVFDAKDDDDDDDDDHDDSHQVVDGKPQFQDHLNLVQSYLDNIVELKAAADKLLATFSPTPTLLDSLRTDYHLRLLWGHRGAGLSFDERHAKFDKVIGALVKLYKEMES